MTSHANKVLNILIRCSGTEHYKLYLEYGKGCVTAVAEGNNIRSVKMPYHSEEMRDVIAYLADHGYIEYTNLAHLYITVTHAGRTARETAFRDTLRAFWSSVAVPVVVSVITSIIITVLYHILAIWFPWITPA